MFLYLDSWYIYYYVSLWNSNCSKKKKSSNSKFHFKRKKKRKKISSKISSQESYISKHIHAPFAIQEKSRAGAKRGQHPLFPRFFFPHHFAETDSQAAWKEKWGKANVSSYAAGYKRQCLALQALCLLCNYVLQRWREESGKKRKKERNGLALHLHFSRDKTWWRRGKLVFANEKRQGRGKTGVARQLRGGGWKQRFAETAANNYARNALIFAQLRKPITLSDATNFIPFSLSLSLIFHGTRLHRASKTGFYLSRRFIVYVRLTRLSTPLDLFLRD